MIIRTFKELEKLKTFKERFNYLRLTGLVGSSTFGFDRYLNQVLYTSREWRSVRDQVIIRDNGCDLGIEGYEISDRILVHHMNPINKDDIKHGNTDIFDPMFLVCTSRDTHQAIHYSDESLLRKNPVIRRPGDTCPWTTNNQNGRR